MEIVEQHADFLEKKKKNQAQILQGQQRIVAWPGRKAELCGPDSWLPRFIFPLGSLAFALRMLVAIIHW